MRIEIGSGTKPSARLRSRRHGRSRAVDVVDDGRSLSTFDDGVVDEIYAHWFLEHVARHEVAPMLDRWMQVLKPGGHLHLVTNNHEAHNRCLLAGRISWEEWSYLVYAIENKRGYSVWDVHKCAWNAELLTETLQAAGFAQVNVNAQWDCREPDGRLKCPALIGQARKPG